MMKKLKVWLCGLTLVVAQALLGATCEFDCRSADAPVFDTKLSVGDRLVLLLPGNARYAIDLVESSLSKIGGEAFLGRVEGSDGLLTAAVVSGKAGLKVTFTAPDDGQTYVVRSTVRGVRVRKVDPADSLRVPTPTMVPVRKPSSNPVRRASRLAQSGGSVTVDVLVAYEKGAKSWLDGEGQDAETFALSAVTRMNAALANTGLTSSFRFRLVGTLAVEARGADFGTVLDAVTDGKGAWSAVSKYRDDVGADIVTTLIDTGSASGSTGLAWSLMAGTEGGDYSWFSESAYNVCAIRAVEISHTMTHEVGHNMGAGHSDIQSTEPGPQLFAYSCGYYFTAKGKPYHTIMAYDTDGNSGIHYMEVPYFSSPIHQYEGVPVGDDKHDNTQTLKKTFAQVAAFRAAKTEPTEDPDPGQDALVWHTTKAEAFAAAEASGKRVLLVYGRDTCANTTATRNYTCEDAAVKARLLADYVLWYSNCDTQSQESSRYLKNFEGTLPGVSVIDVVTGKTVAGAGGYQSVNAMLALLDEAEQGTSPSVSSLTEARIRAFDTGKLLFVLNGYAKETNTQSVRDYLAGLGTAFSKDFELYFCDIGSDTTGMAFYAWPAYAVFDPLDFKANWKDGLLAKDFESGASEVAVQKVLDDALDEYARSAAPDSSDRHLICYELDGGQNADENPASYKQEELPLSLADPSRDSHVFLGWELNGEAVTEIAKGESGHLVLVAKWREATADDCVWSYVIRNGEAKIYAGWYEPAVTPMPMGELVIPSTLGGCPVTEIGDTAFAFGEMTKLTIPSTVRKIGSNVFDRCPNLEIVVDPRNAWFSSEDGVLYDKAKTTLICCPISKTTISIPSTVTELAESAFDCCQCLETIDLPAGLKRIGAYAFNECRGLKDISFPEGLESIGTRSLGNAYGQITQLHIPASVTNIDENAWGEAWRIVKVTVAADNPCYEMVDGMLYDKVRHRVMFCERNKTKAVVRAGTTTVDDYAFAYCFDLSEVTLPSTLVSIHYASFWGCAFASVTLPASLDELQGDAFSCCSNLRDVYFDGKCPGYVGMWPFRDTPANLTVHVQKGAASWPAPVQEDSALYWPERDGYARRLVFRTDMPAVTHQVVFDLGEYGRCDDASVLTQTVVGGMAATAPVVTYVGPSTMYFEGWDADFSKVTGDLVVHAVYRSNVEPWSDGAHTQKIGDYTWSFTISGGRATVYRGWYDAAVSPSPEGAISIPDRLGNCPVTGLGSTIFASCSKLRSVTIPAGVTTISSYAFDSCEGLESIQVAEGSASFVSLDGILYDHAQTTLLRCPQKKTSVTVPDGVTKIGISAFAEGLLENVALPDGLKVIEDFAFQDCNRLASITLPASLEELRGRSFYCCALTTIVIPARVRLLEESFEYCSALKSVYFLGNAPAIISRYSPFQYGVPEGLTVYVRHGSWGWSDPLSDALPVAWPMGVEESRSIAYWEGEKSVQNHRVTYELDGGENAEENPASFMADILPIALADPEREGYKFRGWSMGGTAVTQIARGTADDIVLTALWEEVKPLVWYTTKAEAFAAAEASGKRVLLVFGRDTCGNTTATRLYSCEDEAVREKLLADYILWYSNCDTQSQESYRYLKNFDGYLPGMSVIDLELDRGIVGASGYLDVEDVLALLEKAETYEPPKPPANDDFAKATELSGASGSVSATNDGATSETGEPMHRIFSSATATVWWKWTVPADGIAKIVTAGSTLDTQVCIYTGSSLSSLSLVTGNDDAGGDQSSLCMFDCKRGTTYYICVGGYAGREGPIELGWCLMAPPDYGAGKVSEFGLTETMGGGTARIVGVANLVADSFVSTLYQGNTWAMDGRPPEDDSYYYLCFTGDASLIDVEKDSVYNNEDDFWCSEFTALNLAYFGGWIPKSRYATVDAAAKALRDAHGAEDWDITFGWLNGKLASFGLADKGDVYDYLASFDGDFREEAFHQFLATQFAGAKRLVALNVSGHAVSCCGYSVDEDDCLNGLFVIDSDNDMFNGGGSKSPNRIMFCPLVEDEQDGLMIANIFAEEWTPISSAYAMKAADEPSAPKVVFDAGAGRVEPSEKLLQFGEPFGELPTPERTGYSFAGWRSDAYGTVTEDTVVQQDGVITLRAEWIAHIYSVRFDANGGTGEMDDLTGLLYGMQTTLPANSFVHEREAMKFKGWALTPEGEVSYRNRSPVSDLTDEDGAVVTLYAVWAETPDGISFDACGMEVEKDGVIGLTVFGGSEESAVSVKLSVSYANAKASDLDLKNAEVSGAKGLKFPLTLTWQKGDTEPKTVSIPTASGKATDAPKYLFLNLSDATGLELGIMPSCRITIAAGAAWDGKDVYVLPYVEGAGGKVSGGAGVRPDAKGSCKAVTLKATANKGYWFAGWYDEGGNWASGDLSFKVTPDGTASLAAYEARFVPERPGLCGTYNGYARINLAGMTLVKNADTSADVYGEYAFTATLSTAGKVSGSVTVGGKKITLKGDSVCEADDDYVSCLVVADEKALFGTANSETLKVSFSSDGVVDVYAQERGVGFAPLGGEKSYGFGFKDVSKDTAESAKLAVFAGTYAGASVQADGGVVPVSIVVDKDGKVKLAGRYGDGTALSASGALCCYCEDESGNQTAELVLVMTPKTLGCGAYRLKGSVCKDEDGQPSLSLSGYTTTYTAKNVSAVVDSSSQEACLFTPECWIPTDEELADPDFGAVRLASDGEQIDVLYASKNGTITGLGSALTPGVTVKFDTKTGIFTVTKGKTYTIQGVLGDYENGCRAAGRINADGTLLPVGVDYVKLSEPEEAFPWEGEEFSLALGQNFDPAMQASVTSDGTPLELTITGLPSGLKYDKKTGLITGAPTKAGTFAVKVSYKYGSRTITRTTSFVVSEMPENLSVGTYSGYAVVLIGGDEGKPVSYPFSVTIGKNGALSGSITLFGKKATLKASGYSSSCEEVVAYSATLDLKSIDTKWDSTTVCLEVGADTLVGWGTEDFGSGHEFGCVSAVRNQAKDAAFADRVAPYVGSYVAAFDTRSDAAAGVTTLSVTVDQKGSAKVAGTFFDGTAFSASATLAVFDCCGSAKLIVPMSLKTLGAGALCLELQFSAAEDEESAPTVDAWVCGAHYELSGGLYVPHEIASKYACCYSSLAWVDERVDSDKTCLEVTCSNGAFADACFAWSTKVSVCGRQITGVGKKLSGPNLSFKLDDKTGLFSGACGTYKIFGAMENGTCSGSGMVVGKDGSVGQVYVRVADLRRE